MMIWAGNNQFYIDYWIYVLPAFRLIYNLHLAP